eukprot:Pgem_evm1s7085
MYNNPVLLLSLLFVLLTILSHSVESEGKHVHQLVYHHHHHHHHQHQNQPTKAKRTVKIGVVKAGANEHFHDLELSGVNNETLLCGESFECNIINRFCDYVKNLTNDLEEFDCTIIPLDNLTSRLTELDNNVVDVVISRFSVTATREEVVDFVQPYYYLDGTILFTTDEKYDNAVENNLTLNSINENGNDKIENVVCVRTGYFALEQLKETFQSITFKEVDIEDAKENINSNACLGLAWDSSSIFEGVRAVPGELMFSAPYGAAVKMGDVMTKSIVSSYMVSIMNNGADSPLLRYEDEFLVQNNVPQVMQICQQVNFITNLNALNHDASMCK